MGIAGLTSRLESYGERCILGRSGAEPHSGAIIDGPGLAHYIVREHRRRRASNGEAAEIDETYEDLADETIEWLQSLSSFGFIIIAILFDGALPVSKREVRRSRLRDNGARLKKWKAARDLKQDRAVDRLPPPFLVPAIVEALKKYEKYSALVHVVPGEADPFCAAAADSVPKERDMNVTIFSDDSDMLIYPASLKTSVAPYRDLEIVGPSDKPILSGLRYQPHNLATRFSNVGKGLVEPAFYMSMDPYCTFDGACRKVRDGGHWQTPDFVKFAQQFHVSPEMRRWENARLNKSAPRNCLDARVSEFIYQLESRQAAEAIVELEIYLPFLIEDPARSTAWHVADDIRLLAFSIPIMLEYSKNFHIREFHRSNGADGMKAVAMEPLEASDLLKQVHDLSMSFSEHTQWVERDERASYGDSLDRAEAWRCFIGQRVVSHAIEMGRTSPTAKDLIAATKHDAPQASWERQQLAAEYQAVFYSLRMLKQILKYSIQKASDGVHESMQRLDDQLLSLPSISEFFEPLLNSAKRSRLEEAVQNLVALRVKPSQAVENDTREECKKKRRKKKSPNKPASGAFAANPYSLLAE